MRERIYLDWNATTPLRREAREAMAAAWELRGNPSSVHAEGRHARRLIEDARATIAAAIGVQPRTVVFTSGGTEANALGLTPGFRSGPGATIERLAVSAIEHVSVLAGGRFLPDAVSRIKVTRDGVVDLDHLKTLLATGGPALVSVMAANNETGAVQPLREAAEMVRGAGGLLHVDAVQAFGKIPFDVNSLGGDLVSLSAHKIGGPKGVGALIVGERVEGFVPALRGGGQEFGRRAGTENVAGIAGFGAAVRAALSGLEAEALRVASLRDRLEHGLKETLGAMVFASEVPRLPNTTLFAVPGLRAETAVIAFDLAGVAVSSGSACSSGKVQPSHVLQAMGFPPKVTQGAVRLSLGWSTTDAEIDSCLEAWRKLANTLLREEETRVERF